METPFRDLALEGASVPIAAKAWGPPEGPPILALHGWLDNAASFDALAPLLLKGRNPPQIVVLDLPGHGRSGHRPHGRLPYHFVDWVPEVAAALRALKWERFTLLGHSMGAAIASLVAAAMPDRVEKLVLLDGLAPLTGDDEDLPEKLARFLTETEGASPRLPVYRSLDDAAEARVRAGGLSLEAARILSERGTKAVDGGLTWRSDPRLRLTTPQRMTSGQAQACLRRINCPVLLVRFTQSHLPVDEDEVARQCACLKQATLRNLAGGHHMHLEDPKAVGREVARFLES